MSYDMTFPALGSRVTILFIEPRLDAWLWHLPASALRFIYGLTRIVLRDLSTQQGGEVVVSPFTGGPFCSGSRPLFRSAHGGI